MKVKTKIIRIASDPDMAANQMNEANANLVGAGALLEAIYPDTILFEDYIESTGKSNYKLLRIDSDPDIATEQINEAIESIGYSVNYVRRIDSDIVSIEYDPESDYVSDLPRVKVVRISPDTDIATEQVNEAIEDIYKEHDEKIRNLDVFSLSPDTLIVKYNYGDEDGYNIRCKLLRIASDPDIATEQINEAIAKLDGGTMWLEAIYPDTILIQYDTEDDWTVNCKLLRIASDPDIATEQINEAIEAIESLDEYCVDGMRRIYPDTVMITYYSDDPDPFRAKVVRIASDPDIATEQINEAIDDIYKEHDEKIRNLDIFSLYPDTLVVVYNY